MTVCFRPICVHAGYNKRYHLKISYRSPIHLGDLSSLISYSISYALSGPRQLKACQFLMQLYL